MYVFVSLPAAIRAPASFSLETTPSVPATAGWETRYLQVPVDDPHVVQVLHRIQDLVDELAGVSLRVESFLYDPVEQLAAGNAENRRNKSWTPTFTVISSGGDRIRQEKERVELTAA